MARPPETYETSSDPDDEEEEASEDDDGNDDDNDSHSHSDTHYTGVSWRQDFKTVLDGIAGAGKISVSKTYQLFANPGLKIEGHSVIPLPLTESDAQAIKNVCQQAPLGKGDETLVDTSVRNTWELDHAQVSIENPYWSTFFEQVVSETGMALGLEGITAKPHKLLLYEPGSFFKRHKDSEKEEGMIGTLVICLPSQHEGADVHQSFGSENQVLTTAPVSAFDMTALAWFSDVVHEVKELTSGYRLVLTYKLFQTEGPSRSASAVSQQTQLLKNFFVDWGRNHSETSKLAYNLDHQYTESSLSLANMKGRDHAVCQALSGLVSQYGLYLLFARLTRTDSDPDDDDAETPESTFTYVCSSTGDQVAANVSADEEDIVGVTYKDREPDREAEGEFTGNEGAPGTFRYHDIVVLLIRKEHVECLLPKANLTYSPLFGVMKALEPDQNSVNLLAMVDKDLQETTPDEETRDATVKFMMEAVRRGILCDPASGALVAKWSLHLRNKALLATVMKQSSSEYFESMKSVGEEILAFLEEKVAQEKPVDLDKWLGFIVQGGRPAEAADIFLRFQVLRLPGGLRVSIHEWGEAALDAQMDHNIQWCDEDFAYVGRRLHERGADTDWLMDKLLPNLAAGGPRDLLFETLHQILKFSRGRLVGKAKSMWEYLLKNSGTTLQLQAKDLHYDRRSWKKKLNSYDTPTRKFSRMVEGAHVVGAGDVANPVLDTTCENLVSTAGEWRSSMGGCAIVQEFLVPLATVLKKYKIQPIPSVRAFYLECLEQFQRDLPPKPSKALQGWAHKPRKCPRDAKVSLEVRSLNPCRDCDDLNTFMTSTTEQTWSFSADGRRRKHVVSDLPKTMFSHTTLKQGIPHTLVIEKLGKESERAKTEYAKALQDLESGVQSLRAGHVKELLGDEEYDELVLLRKLDVAVVDKVDDDGGSGTKRAGGGPKGSVSKRRRK